MSTPPKPPAMHDRVDIYWPTCERYFRGTVARAVRPTWCTFFIHYDDDEYLRTNLNKVRWHYVTDSCCKGEQDVLLVHDFLPGDAQRLFGGAKVAQKSVAVGRVGKERRAKVVQRTIARKEASSGLRDGTSEQSKTLSTLDVSDGMDGKTAVDSTCFEDEVLIASKWDNQVKGRMTNEGNSRGTEKQRWGAGLRAEDERDIREHWKKHMLAGCENNNRA